MRLFYLELKKELKRKSFLFIIILIVLISFISVFIGKKSNIKNYSIYEIVSYDNSYKHDSYDKYKNEVNKVNVINNYLNSSNKKIYNVLDNSYVLILFLSFAVGISSGTLISSECESGVIKNVIGKYKNKNTFILNKIFLSFLITCLYLLTLFIFMIFFSSVFFKVNILSLKYPIIVNNKLVLSNYLLYFIRKYFINSIPIYFISLLSLFLSLVIRKSFVVVSFISLLSVIGPSISNILFNINFKFISYTFLPYLDFSIFNDSVNILYNNMFYGINLSVCNGIIVLLSTLFILLIMMFAINKKMEYK